MADGFFLGGAAEGMQNAQLMGLKERAQQFDETRQLTAEVDNNIAGTMGVIAQIVKSGLEAGKTPQQLEKAIQPLLASAASIAAKGGRDPNMIMQQAKGLLSISPTPTTISAKTDVGKINEDFNKGLITAEQRDAAFTHATRAEKGPNTMESIRAKIAGGEELTPGENRLYTDHIDALKALQNRIIGNIGADGVAPGTAPLLASQGEKLAQSPTLPQEAAAKLKEGVITIFANGQRWTLQGGKPKQLEALKQK